MEINTKTWEKITQLQLILMIYLSLVSCLIKTDYNFIISLFGYQLWTKRINKKPETKSIDIRRILLILLLLTIIYDQIWFLMVKKQWNNEIGISEAIVWKKLQNMQSINMFCSFFVMIFKMSASFAQINSRVDEDEDEMEDLFLMGENDNVS